MLTECSEGSDRCRDLRPQAGVDIPRPTPLSRPAHRPGSHGTCCAGKVPGGYHISLALKNVQKLSSYLLNQIS